jgi:hypothetical protein
MQLNLSGAGLAMPRMLENATEAARLELPPSVSENRVGESPRRLVAIAA